MSNTAALRMNRALLTAGEVQSDLTPAAKISFLFLCLFTIAIYARPEDVFPPIGRIHLTLLLGICASVTYLGAWFAGNVHFRNSRELRLMLYLSAWFTLGVPFAYWRGGSFQVLTQEWFKTLIIFFLLTQILLSVRRIRIVLWAIILSELAVTAYSVLDPARSMWIGARLSGVSEGILGWNFVGLAAALTIPYVAVLFVFRPSVLKSSLLAAAIAAMMWMMVLTASRSGILTVAVSIILTWCLILRRTALGTLVGLGLALVLVIAVCAAPGVFWQRIETIWSDSPPTTNVAASADASEQDRRALLIASARYTLEHPVFGVGLGNFSVVRGTETGVPSGWNGSHNTFTEISSEGGIPALLIFVILIGSSLWSMRRIARSDVATSQAAERNLISRATLASILSFVLGAFFAHIGYEYFLYYPIAIGVAVQHLASPVESATAGIHRFARSPLNAVSASHL